MLISTSWDDLSSVAEKVKKPIVLTIGFFDGVHVGHQALLQEAKSKGSSVVLTFSNHPETVLKQNAPPLLCTVEEKVERLSRLGISALLLWEFTEELSQIPYDEFLQEMKHLLSFSYLVQGKGDRFGYLGGGTEESVKKWETILNFKAFYIEKTTIEGEEVSSSKIRLLLQKEKTQKASLLLGQPL